MVSNTALLAAVVFLALALCAGAWLRARPAGRPSRGRMRARCTSIHEALPIRSDRRVFTRTASDETRRGQLTIGKI